MKHDHIFRCDVCGHPAENPFLSLDRRVEKLSVSTDEGKPVTSINVAACQTLFTYCGHECWQAHQPDVADTLELKSTFPAFSFVTPCCRCGKAVNRTQRYVCYNISELNVEGEDVLIGHCIDDQDFAVLCRECEEPDLPAAAAESDNTEKEEEEVFV